MKILALDHAEALGGAELSLLALFRTLDREHFQVTLGGPPGPLAEASLSLGVPHIDLRLGKLHSWSMLASLWNYWSGCRALRRLVRKGAFDLVHTNTLRTAVYAAGAGVPFVWHVRDFYMPGWARRRLLKRCAAAIAVSRFIAGYLGDSPKVRLVLNGLGPVEEVPAETAIAFRREVGLPDEGPVVGIMGRMQPWKGQASFVETAAAVSKSHPDVRFLIVGETLFFDPKRDYEDEVAEAIDAFGMGDKIIWCGHRNDPLTALLAMDVVVNCSENEPFGRVLVEAMACRRPIAAFDSGAVSEIVVDGETGILVPFGDVPGLADAIETLLDDPVRAAAMGEAGRRRVAEHFPQAATTRGVEEVYRTAVSPT